MKTELLGSFAEARQWLLNYLDSAKFRNDIVKGSLEADWTPFSPKKSAYLLGVVWGRLRQMNSALENDLEYAKLVQAGLDEDES